MNTSSTHGGIDSTYEYIYKFIYIYIYILSIPPCIYTYSSYICIVYYKPDSLKLKQVIW